MKALIVSFKNSAEFTIIYGFSAILLSWIHILAAVILMATLFWIYYGEMKPNMIGDRYESVMVKRRLTIIEASSLYALPFMISSFALLLSPIAIGGIEIPSIVIFIIGCILIGWILIVIKKRLLALEA